MTEFIYKNSNITYIYELKNIKIEDRKYLWKKTLFLKVSNITFKEF